MKKSVVPQKRERTASRDGNHTKGDVARPHVSVINNVKGARKTASDALIEDTESCSAVRGVISSLASDARAVCAVMDGGCVHQASEKVNTECVTPVMVPSQASTLSDGQEAYSDSCMTDMVDDSHDRDVMELRQDPIYRIMHTIPRSDVLEVIKCRFGSAQCARAVKYFDMSYTQNPLRKLRLQIGCAGATGMYKFFPRIFKHRLSLRTLDLSRNKLTASDVATLCTGLGLHARAHSSCSADGDVKNALHPLPQTRLVSGVLDVPPNLSEAVQRLCHATEVTVPNVNDTDKPCSLELIDLSYNADIGNSGAVLLLNALRDNTIIRAVQLKHVNIDDEGACQLAPLLRSRPRPSESVVNNFARDNSTHSGGFFVNLNENRIGACGTRALGYRLPDYVSITLCKQSVKVKVNT